MTEPTNLSVAIGHKGFAWVTIETRGRAAHGSRPQERRDAIVRMGRVLNRLEALDHELQAGPTHSLLGTPSLHASTIDGGHELSVYPSRCTLNLERRTLVGEPMASRLMRCSTSSSSYVSRTQSLMPQLNHNWNARRTKWRLIIRCRLLYSQSSEQPVTRPESPVCRSGPTPPSSLEPVFPRSYSDRLAAVFTALRSMSNSSRC